MAFPSIHIRFHSAATATIARAERGIVALLLRDAAAAAAGLHVLTSAADAPAELGEENRLLVARAFLGYITPPLRVLLYVMGEEEEVADALEVLGARDFDFLAPPPDVTQAQCDIIASWIQARRRDDHAIYKAVLPNTAADHEAIVNFVAEGLRAGDEAYTAASYCGRMAGLFAGTPLTAAPTFAPLPELTGVARMSTAEAVAANAAGQFILIHDGAKVKTGGGVTSFVTETADKGKIYRKIKLVQIMDIINRDIRTTVQDGYIGKYGNSYDNKCLLITAISGYFEGLERDGILAVGGSSCGIDLAANEAYLKARGVDTAGMTEQQLREADTGDAVFLSAKITILDAIEQVELQIAV